MTETNRRTFLQALGMGTVAAALPASISRALAIPANNATGTINDVQHIVVLMQENRSFDHYFGTLRGVRGFGDPRAVNLPSGQSVWHQPTGTGTDYVLPFHPDAPDMGLQFLQDLPHDWDSTHAAWNNGKYDQWVPNKGPTTMAYLRRHDIPFHYALADAFTICDAYHASLLGPTDPNRYHMWTGWVGNDGNGGGPVIDNAEAGYGWSTYPERLQAAGITWKIYQDVGTGLTAAGYWGWTSDAYIGNYGDNSLLYFHQYQNAQPGNPLADLAKTGTDISVGGTLFDVLIADINNGTLPQVSWIVAPEAYTEHPNWPVNYGAWYISQVLDALTAKPEVWAKTVLFLTFDENDGFFDHMVPPTPPQSRGDGISTVATTNEVFAGVPGSFVAGPYGLGVRVPMIVISPWSKGGFVNSEVFDHTSIIRFIEQRFGPQNPELVEPNITEWRRAVTGDLTSTLNFASPNAAIVPLPSTASYVPPDNDRHPDYVPAVPTTQSLPLQEPGLRYARPLPYQPRVSAWADTDTGSVHVHFANDGTAGIVFQVRVPHGSYGPWSYTVTPGRHVTEVWPFTAHGASEYDLSVYGPNGFLRAYRGSLLAPGLANLQIDTTQDAMAETITLHIGNRAETAADVTVTNVYTGETTTDTIAVGGHVKRTWELRAFYGWYDLVVQVGTDQTFRQHLAGHIETGRDSASDPALGGLGRAP